jgi:hypothetical protein
VPVLFRPPGKPRTASAVLLSCSRHGSPSFNEIETPWIENAVFRVSNGLPLIRVSTRLNPRVLSTPCHFNGLPLARARHTAPADVAAYSELRPPLAP